MTVENKSHLHNCEHFLTVIDLKLYDSTGRNAQLDLGFFCQYILKANADTLQFFSLIFLFCYSYYDIIISSFVCVILFLALMYILNESYVMLYKQPDCREYMLAGGANGQDEEKNSKI